MEIVHLVFNKPDHFNRKLVSAVDQLAAEQAKLGHSVNLWEIGNAPSDNFQFRAYHTSLFRVKDFIWSPTDEINEAIKNLKRDTIIHMHGGFIPMFISLAVQFRKRNIPFIYTSHGTFNKNILQSSGILRKLYFRFFENILIKWSAAVHFEGRNEREQIGETGLTENKKVFFIPNGLNNGNHLTPPKLRKNTEPVFGYFGKLEIEEGGLDTLLHAFAEYRFKYFEKGELWIVGEGEGREELMQLASRLGVQDSVLFKGNILGNRKFELLNKIDVFLRPSRVEYNTASILEAASSSVPAVVSKETNMGEYINEYDAGYEMTENNANCLAKNMIKCLKDIRQQRWNYKRRNAYRMVNEKFQWKTIAKEHIHAYQQVLVEQVA
ncbi:MAG: glycosyltransferase family 4 protein [Sphingobacteriia bacterium]|nr:glycosyltransferase family 4 protein [Sphingobacteriia bacterium]